MVQKRSHFGVLLTSIEEECQSQIWEGISAFATEHNIAVTAFIGTFQQKSKVLETHYDVAYDFARHSDTLDGMLFFGGHIVDGIGLERAKEYCQTFSSLPLVTISMQYDTVPAILVDNRRGMEEIVEHLITKHNKRKIAFISGSAGHFEAASRLQAYYTVLQKHNIPIDKDLVCYGNFSHQSGRDAVVTLLNVRYTDFDAIVAVDDATALGAMEELQAHGICVPDDIVVTGFDDIQTAKIVTPSLTTTQQPFFDLGYKGAEKLLALSHNEEGVERVTYLKPTFVMRRSCGCMPQVLHDSLGLQADGLHGFRESLINILEYVDVPAHVASDWLSRLSILLGRTEMTADIFLAEFDRIIIDFKEYNNNLDIWLTILNRFQMVVMQFFKDDYATIERLNMIILQCAGYLQHANMKEARRIEVENENIQWSIRGIAHHITTSFDMEDVQKKMVEGFHQLKIGHALVLLYEEPILYHSEKGWVEPKTVLPLFAMKRGEQLDLTALPQTVSLAQILQYEESLFGNEHRAMLFLPLFFGNEQLGVMLIEEAKEQPIDMYESLRLSVSTALKGAFLFNEVKELSIKDELTSLYNRRGFMMLAEAKIDHIKRNNTPATLLFIDLDGLKAVNDTFGHNEGDKAIFYSATILKNTLREEDIVGRIGGDEFALLALDPYRRGSSDLIERIQKAFAEFNDKIMLPYNLSCSIGAEEICIDKILSLDELLSRADKRLYKEKRSKQEG